MSDAHQHVARADLRRRNVGDDGGAVFDQDLFQGRNLRLIWKTGRVFSAARSRT
jgi:hypothetical protein